MKLLWTLAFLALGASTLMAQSKPTIFIAGDSTASLYTKNEAPRMGWGQVLGRFFTADVVVDDRAQSGRSSLSFVTEGFFDKLFAAVKPGDLVLIQFGHNDEKKEDPSRYTVAFGSFQEQLTKYVEAARAKSATPILLTPIERRNFSNGLIKASHKDYPLAVRDLAKRLKVQIIDLTESTTALYNKTGAEATKKLFLHLQPGDSPNYPKGVADNTHLQEAGALAIAELVVAGLRDLKSPVTQWLKN